MVVAAQQPRITNGRVTAQPAGRRSRRRSDRSCRRQADVAWIGYAVPVVDGERSMCCFGGDTTWVSGNVVRSDRSGCCRACRLEPSADGTSMATRAPGGNRRPAPSGWKASDRMVVLFRVVDRAVDRIRVFSEDCELDAGGRTVIWLDGCARPRASRCSSRSRAGRRPARSRRRRRDQAIALHGDRGADARSSGWSPPVSREAVRKKVTFWLGNTRGARGLAMLQRVLKDDPSGEVRKGGGVRRLAEPRSRRRSTC